MLYWNGKTEKEHESKMKKYYCKCCGDEIPESTVKQIIEDHLQWMRSIGGKTITEKKRSAHRLNAERINAAYTPEKRKEAQRKRLETLARKKQAESQRKSE